jgi:hypothetical protein
MNPEVRTRIIMTDQTAEAARLMKVTEAVVEELARQGVVEIMADEGFEFRRHGQGGHQGGRRRRGSSQEGPTS